MMSSCKPNCSVLTFLLYSILIFLLSDCMQIKSNETKLNQCSLQLPVRFSVQLKSIHSSTQEAFAYAVLSASLSLPPLYKHSSRPSPSLTLMSTCVIFYSITRFYPLCLQVNELIQMYNNKNNTRRAVANCR